MNATNEIHFLGIRHHGPGCAKSVQAFLDEYKPDLILLEAPENTQELLEKTDISTFKLPVAILLFKEGEAENNYVLPFAKFSPEWIAIQYAKATAVPIHAIDLPLGVKFNYDDEQIEPEDVTFPIKNTVDAFRYLAQLQGIEDVEQWWEINFEQTSSPSENFKQIQSIIDAIRPAIEAGSDQYNKAREANMRQHIRNAVKSGLYKRIVVITGAAHLPFVRDYKKFSAKEDKALFKPQSKAKLTCNWIPWSYQRLSSINHYDAGVQYPLYYEHIFEYGASAPVTITSSLSLHLRKKGYDISLAHTLESVNLAQTLANLRSTDIPGIDTIIEACSAVYGLDQKFKTDELLKEGLIGDTLGEVPVNITNQALIVDFERKIKDCKLKKYTQDTKSHDLTLDLRNPVQLEASRLIWQLRLLGITWGKEAKGRTSAKGSFNEHWSLKWKSEFLILLFHQCLYGSSIDQAAAIKTKDELNRKDNVLFYLDILTPVINSQIADLTEFLLKQIENTLFKQEEAESWMQLIPQLCGYFKYGSVRSLDLSQVKNLIEILVTRLTINFENILISIPEQDLDSTLDTMIRLHHAILQTGEESLTLLWMGHIERLLYTFEIPAIFRGWITGVCMEKKIIDLDEALGLMTDEMSDRENLEPSVAWLLGIMSSQVFTAFAVPSIVKIIDLWLADIDYERFREILPGLRKAFSKNSTKLKASFRMHSGKVKPALDTWTREKIIDEDLTKIFSGYIKSFIPT